MSNLQTFFGPRMCSMLIATASFILLAACNNVSSGRQTGRLSACSASGTVFARTPFPEWSKVYHGSGGAAIQEYMSTYQNLESKPAPCISVDGSGTIPASPTLQKIASGLPGWSGATITQFDMVPILLDYLRVYECSMYERLQNNRLIGIGEEVRQTGIPLTLRGTIDQNATSGALLIQRELATSRIALERALTLVGAYDRFGKLVTQFECMTRASLDLRNTIGLGNDLAACLPRIWDAHGSYRNIIEPPPPEN